MKSFSVTAEARRAVPERNCSPNPHLFSLVFYMLKVPRPEIWYSDIIFNFLI